MDIAKLFPKLEFPRVMSEELARSFSQAAVTTRVFEQMESLSLAHKQIEERLRPAVDIAKALPKLDFADQFTGQQMAELVKSARRLEAVLSASQRPSQSGPPSSNDGTPESTDDPELAASLLLVACFALVAVAAPEAVPPLVTVSRSIIESGLITGRAAVDAYRTLSDAMPDYKLVAWALLLAQIVRRARRRLSQRDSPDHYGSSG